MKVMNKEEIRENLFNYESFLDYEDLDVLDIQESNYKSIERAINKRMKEIKELQMELEVLEEEKRKMKDYINTFNNKKQIVVLSIKENLKRDKWDYYSLTLDLSIICEDYSKVIKNLEYQTLTFTERGKYKDAIVTDWINKYKIDEIKTNVTLKNIKNINNVKVSEIEN